MNKKELAALIAKGACLTQEQAAKALDATINIIKEELVKPGKKTTRALDSTILLIRPENDKPKKARALDSTVQLIPEHLVTTGKVTLPSLGTFYTIQRKARVGRNPQTGAEVKIKAHTVAKFKPSRTLIDQVNE